MARLSYPSLALSAFPIFRTERNFWSSGAIVSKHRKHPFKDNLWLYTVVYRTHKKEKTVAPRAFCGLAN
jgi:hypothetical protein